MSLSDLLQWWNLVFVLPFGLAAALLLFLSTGLLDFGDHDVDHDVDIDHDIDADHDVEHDGGGEGVMRALGVLGVGRAPISLLLMCFGFVWGFTGMASNLVLKGVLPSPLLYAWISMGVALLTALFLTRTLAFSFARFLGVDEITNVPRSGLIGQRADVRFTVTESSGTAMLYDSFGTLREVSCRVSEGAPSLPHGERVVLMRFDPQRDYFIVRPDPLTAELISSEPARGETGVERELGSGSTHPPPVELS